MLDVALLAQGCLMWLFLHKLNGFWSLGTSESLASGHTAAGPLSHHRHLRLQ